MALDLKKIIEESCKTATIINESVDEIQEAKMHKTSQEVYDDENAKMSMDHEKLGKTQQQIDDENAKMSMDHEKVTGGIHTPGKNEALRLAQKAGPANSENIDAHERAKLAGKAGQTLHSLTKEYGPYAAAAGAAITAGLGGLALRKKMAKMKK